MKDSINNVLVKLINQSQDFGLGVEDIKNAREFLFNYEYGLCFDTIVTQLYEYDIPITKEYYYLISSIGENLKLDVKDYEFMKDLIK